MMRRRRFTPRMPPPPLFFCCAVAAMTRVAAQRRRRDADAAVPPFANAYHYRPLFQPFASAFSAAVHYAFIFDADAFRYSPPLSAARLNASARSENRRENVQRTIKTQTKTIRYRFRFSIWRAAARSPAADARAAHAATPRDAAALIRRLKGANANSEPRRAIPSGSPAFHRPRYFVPPFFELFSRSRYARYMLCAPPPAARHTEMRQHSPQRMPAMPASRSRK